MMRMTPATGTEPAPPCVNGHHISPNTLRVPNEDGSSWVVCWDCKAPVLLPAPPEHWLSRFCASRVGFVLVLALAGYTLYSFWAHVIADVMGGR